MAEDFYFSKLLLSLAWAAVAFVASLVTRTKFTRSTIHLGPPLFHLKGHIIGAVLDIYIILSRRKPSHWSPNT